MKKILILMVCVVVAAFSGCGGDGNNGPYARLKSKLTPEEKEHMYRSIEHVESMDRFGHTYSGEIFWVTIDKKGKYTKHNMNCKKFGKAKMKMIPILDADGQPTGKEAEWWSGHAVRAGYPCPNCRECGGERGYAIK